MSFRAASGGEPVNDVTAINRAHELGKRWLGITPAPWRSSVRLTALRVRSRPGRGVQRAAIPDIRGHPTHRKPVRRAVHGQVSGKASRLHDRPLPTAVEQYWRHQTALALGFRHLRPVAEGGQDLNQSSSSSTKTPSAGASSEPTQAPGYHAGPEQSGRVMELPARHVGDSFGR